MQSPHDLMIEALTIARSAAKTGDVPVGAIVSPDVKVAPVPLNVPEIF